MKAQEIFDKVVKHLRAQNQKSLMDLGGNNITCAYRGSNDLQCAAGCLIPDDLYSPAMEDRSFSNILLRFPRLVETCPWMDEHRVLIHALQAVHDCFLPENWEVQFQSVAERFHLVLAPKET